MGQVEFDARIDFWDLVENASGLSDNFWTYLVVR